MTRAPGPDGIAVVDKAAGWTSHDVVAKARGLLGTRRVGHAGTLDPDATGVLVLGVGRGTRLLRFVTDTRKSYTCEIVLGTGTSTYDAAGDVVATVDMGHVTPDDVRAAAAALTGHIEQVPPMVSAVKVGGRRLHELARAGVEVPRAARPVTVDRFDVSPVPDEPGVYRAEVDCSSGTYVRSLAHDLGRRLGGAAHLRRLRRTAVGPFTLDDAVDPASLSVESLRPLADAVAGMPTLVVDGEQATAVGHGRPLPAASVQPVLAGGGAGPVAVVDAAGTLLAVYEPHRAGTWKPAVVVASGG